MRFFVYLSTDFYPFLPPITQAFQLHYIFFKQDFLSVKHKENNTQHISGMKILCAIFNVTVTLFSVTSMPTELTE